MIYFDSKPLLKNLYRVFVENRLSAIDKERKKQYSY
jgi:hypothetical protein